MAETLSRRSFLEITVATIAIAWRLPMVSAGAQQRRTVVEAVDHVILGASDLDRGIARVEQLTGVKAAIGGVHPGRGTRNALMALGGRQYLEIIAPDPAQPAANLRKDFSGLQEPRMIGWAAATQDIDALAAAFKGSGGTAAGPNDGSRTRPDGRTLRWRTLTPQSRFAPAAIDPIPFFIQWAPDSVHPSQETPSGCRLTAFEFEHPDAHALQAALAQLGLDAVVRQGPQVRLIAKLTTPKGIVVLS